uniref:Uncharacterized protein n=1 Tax=Knipowitschia caucasica TaxID=637954 RepID=A0AAV2K8B5_KNICA
MEYMHWDTHTAVYYVDDRQVHCMAVREPVHCRACLEEQLHAVQLHFCVRCRTEGATELLERDLQEEEAVASTHRSLLPGLYLLCSLEALLVVKELSLVLKH